MSKVKKLKKENDRLREIIDDLFHFAANGDYSNGNTHPDGYGPDEGQVMAQRFLDDIATRALLLGIKLNWTPLAKVYVRPDGSIHVIDVAKCGCEDCYIGLGELN